MKAAELFVKALEHERVEYIFGIPGEENLDFLEALSHSSIKLVVTRHEQSAGFMAATYGRLTGKVGVCLSTLGPGATNLVTAAAYAQLGAMPILMITGQKPIKKSKQGHFQIIDTVQMMRPLTKFTKQIVHAENIPALVRECFRIAIDERPGAVHLELPEDIAAEDIFDTVLFEINQVRRPAAEEKAIARAVDMIEQAKHPLILVGAGANRKLVSKSLLQFIEKTKIPFFSTQMGKGVIDESHPLYLGCAALSGNDYLHCAVDRADLIINVGHDVIEKPPFFMKKDQQVIHVNFCSAHIDSVYFPQWEVIGDIGNALWQITEHITPQNWDTSYALKVKTELFEHMDSEMNEISFPLKPQSIVKTVREILPRDGILSLDNGMYKLWFARYFRTYERNTILLDNALATMGAGLPGGIAAKLVNPEKKVFVVAGDGGFMMNSQELETALRLKLDLVILILNDNGYGMIKWKQESQKMQDFGLSFTNPDFVKYAESYGAHGYRVTETESLKSLLEKTLVLSGVHVIEVPIDYSENYKVFTKELQDKVCPV
jgi:acetolactate synthase-1/2/3 large subunit